jgi:hypothetical protein
MNEDFIILPARTGRAVKLAAGAAIQVVNNSRQPGG